MSKSFFEKEKCVVLTEVVLVMIADAGSFVLEPFLLHWYVSMFAALLKRNVLSVLNKGRGKCCTYQGTVEE